MEAGIATEIEPYIHIRIGADHALNYSDGTWVDQVKLLTGGHGADRKGRSRNGSGENGPGRVVGTDQQ